MDFFYFIFLPEKRIWLHLENKCIIAVTLKRNIIRFVKAQRFTTLLHKVLSVRDVHPVFLFGQSIVEHMNILQGSLHHHQVIFGENETLLNTTQVYSDVLFSALM